jgi:hypothetical protein
VLRPGQAARRAQWPTARWTQTTTLRPSSQLPASTMGGEEGPTKPDPRPLGAVPPLEEAACCDHHQNPPNPRRYLIARIRHVRPTLCQVLAKHLQQPGVLDAEHRGVRPTKTSAQTSARGRARRAGYYSARRRQARPVRPTSYAEPTREARQ